MIESIKSSGRKAVPLSSKLAQSQQLLQVNDCEYFKQENIFDLGFLGNSQDPM